MKLVGEYELTDEGVEIEGKINGSHIHDVRRLLEPLKTTKMYNGDASEVGKTYEVPHPEYRRYIRKYLPNICTPDTESKYIELSANVVTHFGHIYNDACVIANNMGSMYGLYEGRAAIQERVITRLNKLDTANSRRIVKLANSAWVWTADERGDFKIKIEGLVNRHMMTLILASATKMANYIDNVLVKLLDHPNEFTQEIVYERERTRTSTSKKKSLPGFSIQPIPTMPEQRAYPLEPLQPSQYFSMLNQLSSDTHINQVTIQAHGGADVSR